MKVSIHNELGANEILKVQGLCKSYNGEYILKGVSFSLSEKEILGIIGPSGGGKTTLLRSIDLLDPIDQGCIYYDNYVLEGNGKNNTGDAARLVTSPENPSRTLTEEELLKIRRNIGFVFQGFNLWEDKSVLDNLILAHTVVLKTNRKEASEKALELCHQFGLQSKVKSKARDLSGGQKQRVAILRALMMDPRLILLDEITSALDPILTAEVLQAIRKLRDKGLAMIIVTHHIEFASTVCDRIMFLSEGEIVQLDTPSNLRQFPASDDVRKFLEIIKSIS